MPTEPTKTRRRGALRTCLRWTLRAGLGVALLLSIVLAVVLRAALYDRFWRFPRQAKAMAALRAERRPPGLDDGWNEYRGVLHAHSELGHDSAVTQPEAIRALHAADVDFIGMTDHYLDLHADFQDERSRDLMPRVLLCLGAYPDQTVRSIFDAPRPLLARWDALNRQRPITGIGANDAHQNVGYRAVASPSGTLVFSGTGEKTEVLREVRLNGLTRLLVRLLAGPLEPGREVWRWELDPYERSCRFVNTHVLARACTERDIVEALRIGRAFVALVLRDGPVVAVAEGRELDVPIERPGGYRIEVELRLLDEWTPWIYANPIRILPGALP